LSAHPVDRLRDPPVVRSSRVHILRVHHRPAPQRPADPRRSRLPRQLQQRVVRPRLAVPCLLAITYPVRPLVRQPQHLPSHPITRRHRQRIRNRPFLHPAQPPVRIILHRELLRVLRVPVIDRRHPPFRIPCVRCVEAQRIPVVSHVLRRHPSRRVVTVHIRERLPRVLILILHSRQPTPPVLRVTGVQRIRIVGVIHPLLRVLVHVNGLRVIVPRYRPVLHLDQ